MKIRRLLKGFRRGEGGFTLIELLVVVAILGILAAVIVPNIAGFIGSGKVESANTEAHNVETAVVAYMVDYNLITFSGDVGYDTSNGPEVYLTNASTLQAKYTFADASIASATILDGGKWTGLHYTVGTGWEED
jgi:prepilin-type N-terminal cleavage/methylation domain-containing protein